MGDFKFKIEKEYYADTKEEAKEQFIDDIANSNFDIEEVE